MSATPVDPPPLSAATQQQPDTSHGGRGSVGPVIAVLAVITILGVIAGMIGRLCCGRRIMGQGQYDVEGWVERKCSSCIDGYVGPLRRAASGGGGGPREDIPVAEVGEAPQEIKSHRNGNSHS